MSKENLGFQETSFSLKMLISWNRLYDVSRNPLSWNVGAATGSNYLGAAIATGFCRRLTTGFGGREACKRVWQAELTFIHN